MKKLTHIELKNIKFKYENSKEDVLKGISLDIKKGEVVAVLGESGSGKSTLLRILSGFEIPHEGSIRIGDKIILDEKNMVPVEKREIGIVFQDYALFPHLNVRKNVCFGISNFSKKDQNKRLDKVLEVVSMTGYEKRYPHELSGGQQQRIALARAMAPNPDFILMDEPFSNLDANLQQKIREEVGEIIQNSNATALFVSHDKDDAISIADKIVVMEKGEIVQVGAPKDVYENPATPYVAHILGK